MEGSVSNVQFTERKRGFDPDEVANYLAHIDDKIAGLRSIAAEAIERAEQAEERARTAEQRAASTEEGPAQAASVLAMAQQTADATVSAATADAESVLARAREDADRIRLAAEAEAQQLLADTRRDLEVRRTEHLDTLRREIDQLVATRDAVAGDIAALEDYLAGQRARVLEARDALTRVAEDPTALRAGVAPTVVEVDGDWDGGVTASGFGDDAGVIVEDVVVADPDTGMVVEDLVVADLATGEVVEDLVVTDGLTGEVVAEAVVVDNLDPAAVDLPWGDADPGATAPVSVVGGLFDDEATDEPVGDAPAGEAGGLFSDEPTAEPAFGAFDEEDDEAMRAFFEGEVDEGDRPGRWGFRRR